MVRLLRFQSKPNTNNMKNILRKLFSPILNSLEAGDGEFAYRKTDRKILFTFGGLFMFLATCSGAAGVAFSAGGAILPTLVFFSLGLTSLVVAFVGSDRAVAKIWGKR